MTENELDNLLNDLSKALSNGDDNISLTTNNTEDTSFVSIQRKPKKEPTWYVNDLGEIIYEWSEKFEREQKKIFPAFQPGEKIKVSGFVTKEHNGQYKIRVDADGRQADNFFIQKISEPNILQNYNGMSLEVIVEIVQNRKEKFIISNIWNYDVNFVEVIKTPQINPNNEEILKSKPGTRVIVQGEFLGYDTSKQEQFFEDIGFPKNSKITSSTYYTSPSGISNTKLEIQKPDGSEAEYNAINISKEHNNTSTIGRIKTNNRGIIQVNMPTGKTVLSGGNLENLERKLIDVGDVIKIASFVDKDHHLSAHWCDPCTLDTPSESRLGEYSKVRTQAKNSINIIKTSIRTNNYNQARILIGETRTLELTEAELKSIRGLVKKIPEIERPMQSPLTQYNSKGARDYYVTEIDKSYQTKLESMTSEEFVAFTRSAVTGEIKKINRHADTSYLFGIAEDFRIDVKIRESLIIDCIEKRLSKIRGKVYSSANFDDRYNIEQALKYLSGLGTESSFNKSLAYIKNFVDGGDFNEQGWRDNPERIEKFLFSAVNALSTNVTTMPLNLLDRELPYLRRLKRELIKNADEPIVVNILERTIGYIEDKIITN